MNYKITALISAITESFFNLTLDIAVNRINKYRVLLYTSIISGFFQIIYSLFIGINFSIASIPIIIIYGVCVLIGYVAFVKAIQYLPADLVVLIGTGQMFVVFLIDSIFGNIKLTPTFVMLFILFVVSVIWFIIETNKIKSKIYFKNIKLIGVVFALITVLISSVTPYIIKLASNMGANEIAINLGYYVIAIPFFFIMVKGIKEKAQTEDNSYKNKFVLLIVLIGILESIYYPLYTFSYTGGSAFIVTVVTELRIFLLVILSAIFKTDKINWQKAIAMLMGIAAVTGLCLL